MIMKDVPNPEGINFANNYLDKLFEKYLKGFYSKNARQIFELMYESEEKYLTTLDLQYNLKKLGINLNKKELNNWLNYLKDSNLVTKDEKRGKPTTINYNDKYTFDLWKISDIGIKIGKLLPLFRNVIEKNTLVEQKNEFGDNKEFKTVNLSKNIINIKIQNIVKIFNELKKDEISLNVLKYSLQIDDNGIINKIKHCKNDEDKPIFEIFKKEPNIIEKMLIFCGIRKGNKWFITLND